MNIFCIAVCLFSIYLHFFSNVDMQIQQILFSKGSWLISPDDTFFNFFFYLLPKIIVVCCALACLLFFLFARIKKRKLNVATKVGLIVVLFCICLYPVFINILKEILRQPCPRDLKQFGGQYSGSMITYLLQHGEIRCFPGAHASAPFSLIAFKYLFTDDYNRALFLIVILPFATLISLYQVFRGVHFVSDTIFTAFGAWVFADLAYKLVSNYLLRPEGIKISMRRLSERP